MSVSGDDDTNLGVIATSKLWIGQQVATTTNGIHWVVFTIWVSFIFCITKWGALGHHGNKSHTENEDRHVVRESWTRTHQHTPAHTPAHTHQLTPAHTHQHTPAHTHRHTPAHTHQHIHTSTHTHQHTSAHTIVSHYLLDAVHVSDLHTHTAESGQH